MVTTGFAHISRLLQRPALQILLLIVCGSLAYSNTFHVPFILDDYRAIVNNRKLDTVSVFLNSLNWLDFSNKSRWFAFVTFAFNKSIGNGNVTGFHVVNLLIHLATGSTVYYLAKNTLTSFSEKQQQRFAFVPLLASLGFLLHPVQTQAVTYVVQRMTSLATLMFLITLLLYAKVFQAAPSPGSTSGFRQYLLYLLAIISCILAMSSKEISFTLPVLLALYDVCFLAGTARQRIIRLLPFVLCMLIMPFYLVGLDSGMTAINRGGGDAGTIPLSRLTYFYSECRVLVTYLRLLILPVGQNLDYDYPVYDSLLQPQVAGSLLLLMLLFGLGLYLVKTSFKTGCNTPEIHRISGFAILWFFITHAIESGVIPLIDIIFEHRLYLPSVWFFIAMAVLVCELYHRSMQAKAYVAIAAASLLILSGYATWQRNHVWRDSLSLWTDVVQKSPDKVRGWTELGIYYVKKLDPVTAIPLLEHANSITSDYYFAHYWLGRAFMQTGDMENALKQYLITTQLAPNYSKGWEMAGRLLFNRIDKTEAVACLRRALELSPEDFSPQEKAWLMGEL